MKDVVLTPEQKEKLKNCYLITSQGMIALGDSSELSEENFRAFGGVTDNDNNIILKELTVDDFRWCDEYYDDDFEYSDNGDYVSRLYMPKEVVELLDAAIEKRNTAEKNKD